jgi:hypothetical protein
LCSGNTATDTTIVISVQNLFLLVVLTCNDSASEIAWLVGWPVNDELVLMWTEAVVASFEVLICRVPGGTVEYYKEPVRVD